MSTVAQTLSKPRAKTFRDIVKPARALERKSKSLSRSIRFARIRSAQRSPFSARHRHHHCHRRQLAHQRPQRKCPRRNPRSRSDTVIATASRGPLFPGHRVNGLLARAPTRVADDIARACPHVKAASPSMRIFQAAIRLGHRRRAPRRLSRKKCNLARQQRP